MPVSSVKFQSDAICSCLNHALSTEKEEIMGLLIGSIDNNVCSIYAATSLQRSDKRADRVEISPEQLAAGSSRAEALAIQHNIPLRIVGWYHSHPHITVWPSHVDVQTQATYQMMDDGFIGIIFAVFSEDKSSKINKIQITCFQSVNKNADGDIPQYFPVEVPLHIVPVLSLSSPNIDNWHELVKILTEEEKEMYARAQETGDQNIVVKVHNGSVFAKSQCYLMDIIVQPLMRLLESKLLMNEQLEEELEKRKTELLEKLIELNETQV